MVGRTHSGFTSGIQTVRVLQGNRKLQESTVDMLPPELNRFTAMMPKPSSADALTHEKVNNTQRCWKKV